MNYIPLALYIHIPWCIRKCPYCDFNSHESKIIPELEYITSLIQDLKQNQHLAHGRSIQSIFIGGGTPSLFQGDSFRRLFDEINAIHPLASKCEITLEANPGTFEREKFSDYLQAGINRLSIGVQSFSNEQLNTLGRIHDGNDAETAIKIAQDVGFHNINIDLMHGLPQQTSSTALFDLEKATALDPNHLSWYQLTVEPNTVFYSDTPILPTEDDLWQIDQTGKNHLHTAGFTQYETSAFSKKGFQCLHNTNYWQYGDYLAIGAGAHGKITDINTQNILRYQKTRLPKDYLNANKPFTSKQSIISKDELPFEFFMNAFRLHQSIAKDLFEERTFLSRKNIEKTMLEAIKKGFITESKHHWQTTEQGQLFLNSLLELFLTSVTGFD